MRLIIFAIGLLAMSPANVQAEAKGIIYYIPGHDYAWLPPALELAAISGQIFALYWKKIWLLLTGVGIITAAAWLERDITLIVGDVLAAFGIWLCIRKVETKKTGGK